MQVTIFIFITLCVWNNGQQLSHNTKHFWKSRNRQNLPITLPLQGARSPIYYLPRTYKNKLALNQSYTPSFEDVVSQLKEIGILDLPTVR